MKKNNRHSHVEASIVTLIGTGAFAGFAAMFICGPWIYDAGLPDVFFVASRSLLGLSYMSVFLLFWASAIIACLIGGSYSWVRSAQTQTITR